MLRALKDFITYWYFRYLVVTELYIVEKWERAIFHIVLFLFLSIFYVFNVTVVFGLVKWISAPFIVKMEGNMPPITNN